LNIIIIIKLCETIYVLEILCKLETRFIHNI